LCLDYRPAVYATEERAIAKQGLLPEQASGRLWGVCMREVKFRAWNEPEKDMVYSEPMPDMGFWKYVAYDNTTPFMQFTGLKDRENVEIYEGDILEYVYYAKGYRRKENGDRKIVETERRIVEWVANSQFAGFNISNRSANNRLIIGNIYQNPELLK
jgi:hypothetical protein